MNEIKIDLARMFGIFILALFVNGCATLAKPENLNEKLAYAFVTSQNVSESLLQNAAKFDQEQWQEIAGNLKLAKQSLKQTEALIKLYQETKSPNVKDEALDRLNLANDILYLLEAILAEKTQ